MTDLTWPALATSSTPSGTGDTTEGPRTFLLTGTGDLDLTGGRARLISGRRATAQILESRLQVGRGEWWRNLKLGVPYFQDILVHNPERGVLESSIRKVAKGTAGVTVVESVSLDYDRPTRTSRVSVRVSTKKVGQVTVDAVKLRR